MRSFPFVMASAETLPPLVTGAVPPSCLCLCLCSNCCCCCLADFFFFWACHLSKAMLKAWATVSVMASACVCVCVCVCEWVSMSVGVWKDGDWHQTLIFHHSKCNIIYFGLFVTKEGVALQFLVLMVTRDIAEDLVIVWVHSAVRDSEVVTVLGERTSQNTWLNIVRKQSNTTMHLPI